MAGTSGSLQHHVLAMTLLLCGSATLDSATQAEGDKAPVPSDSTVKEALELIQDVFSAEYRDRSSEGRIALAKKMVEQAQATEADAPERYVLLTQAKELASTAGDLDLALSAVTLLSETFNVDLAEFRKEILDTAARSAKTREEFIDVTQQYLSISELALAEDRFTSAKRAANSAVTYARKSRDTALLAHARDKYRRIGDLQRAFSKVEASLKTLTSTPEDAEANQIVGEYYCLMKGDWEKGLPYLAKSGDPSLQKPAEGELSDPSSPEDQAAVADLWWDVSEKHRDEEQDALRMRARGWYEKSLDTLTGLKKLHVEKRLKTLLGDFLKGDWVDFGPKDFGQSGKVVEVEAETRRLSSKPLVGRPRWDYDGISVSVRPPENGLGILLYEGSKRCFWVKRTGDVAVKHLVGADWIADVEKTVPKRSEYMVTVLLELGNYVFYVDGREIGRHPTKFTRMFSLYLGSESGKASFTDFKLRRKR